jgi:hypothetical protein
MAISRKPHAMGKAVDVEALISKGGTAPVAEFAEDSGNVKRLQLRLEPELIAQIDTARSARQIKTPRHTWLLEAVYEKLYREMKATSK